MNEVIFYRDKKGKSEIADLLNDLKIKAETSKTDRVNREKILTYIAALQTYGTHTELPIAKHLEGKLWELRPLDNRIIYFLWQEKRFVLLHHFVKKSQKTPKRELAVAKAKMKDFIERFGE
jgi:phage-related protein